MAHVLIGKRIQMHPATDAWMMGDRYGTIVRMGTKWAYVKLDKSQRITKVLPENANLVADLNRVNAPSLAQLCRCGHPKHASQCPNPTGCWCDTFS